MKKNVPEFHTDEELEAFLEQDLSDYLHEGNFRTDVRFVFPPSFEDQPKDANMNVRLPSAFLNKIKEKAAEQGIGYQKYVRRVLAASLQ